MTSAQIRQILDAQAWPPEIEKALLAAHDTATQTLKALKAAEFRFEMLNKRLIGDLHTVNTLAEIKAAIAAGEREP
jgi:hypothetical protein